VNRKSTSASITEADIPVRGSVTSEEIADGRRAGDDSQHAPVFPVRWAVHRGKWRPGCRGEPEPPHRVHDGAGIDDDRGRCRYAGTRSLPNDADLMHRRSRPYRARGGWCDRNDRESRGGSFRSCWSRYAR